MRRSAPARAPRRRSQGRPNEGKDSVGPESLIRAARELLEVLPPAKVTRAAVARHANVDPNLIRYYFKDRDSLLLAVVEQIISERGRAIQMLQRGTPVERLRGAVREIFEFNATHPYFHRLLVEEVATWKSARARQTFRSLNQAAIGMYADVLRAGAKDRSLRRVDPALLHIAIIGMSEFFLASRVSLEDAYGKGTTPADFAEQYAEMIVGIISDGLRSR